ncbi:hypothetical protein AVEN_258533-1 [Araneus ventricosus]|uniref:Uncharacterized protein n=1 Tax=Araneus ventricosus TaxID=182803 RepID=A0A4Y2I5E8_ARAVE|nr:hypothetical protein AVEN_258533-1 [Araneus ventricosus]
MSSSRANVCDHVNSRRNSVYNSRRTFFGVNLLKFPKLLLVCRKVSSYFLRVLLFIRRFGRWPFPFHFPCFFATVSSPEARNVCDHAELRRSSVQSQKNFLRKKLVHVSQTAFSSQVSSIFSSSIAVYPDLVDGFSFPFPFLVLLCCLSSPEAREWIMRIERSSVHQSQKTFFIEASLCKVPKPFSSSEVSSNFFSRNSPTGR